MMGAVGVAPVELWQERRWIKNDRTGLEDGSGDLFQVTSVDHETGVAIGCYEDRREVHALLDWMRRGSLVVARADRPSASIPRRARGQAKKEIE